MFIVEAIPLIKIPLDRAQILSYFSKTPLKRGALVRAPVAKSIIPAVVINSLPLETQKIQIRKGSFVLKPIYGVISQNPVICENQFKLAKYLSQKYLASLGISLKLFLPESLLKRKRKLKDVLEISSLSETKTFKNDQKPKFLWIENPAPFYFEKIKAVMKRGASCLFLVPNLEELEYWQKKLKENFIKEKIIVYHQNLKPKEKLSKWQESNISGPKIILGTRSSLFLPFRELGLIIIDKEQNPGFGPFGQSPCYDVKEVASYLASLYQAQLILSSSNPSLESYNSLKNGKYLLLKYHIPKKNLAKVKILDLRKTPPEKNKIFAQELKNEISQILNSQGKVLLFVNRKGFARIVLCKECGFVLKCDNCEAPMIYHILKGLMLLCHHCGAKKIVPKNCPNCQGFAIEPLGFGTQKVAKEIQNLFPKANVLELDKNLTPNQILQHKVLEIFFKKSPSVLVATNLILKFQNRFRVSKPKLLISAVVSADSLLFFPEYKTRESFFQIVRFLQSFSSQVFLQTYNPELDFFKILPQNPKIFLDQELKLRQEFDYPPFSELIRLTFAHSSESKAKNEALKLQEKLKSNFQDQAEILGPFPGFIPKIKGKYLWHLLLKCKLNCQEVKAKLPEYLSRNWQVDINPENLL